MGLGDLLKSGADVLLGADKTNALEDLLGANTLQALLDGVVLVPASTVQVVVAEQLEGQLTDVEVELGDRSIDVRGVAERLLARIKVHVAGRNQTYTPKDPLGELALDVEQLDSRASGTVLQRIIGGIVVAIVRALYGDTLLQDSLDSTDGIAVKGSQVRCQLAEIPAVRRVLARDVGGMRPARLIKVRDIVFVLDAVRVEVSVPGLGGPERR